MKDGVTNDLYRDVGDLHQYFERNKENSPIPFEPNQNGIKIIGGICNRWEKQESIDIISNQIFKRQK